MPDLLTPDEVAALLKIDRRTFIRTVIKQPRFPAPVKLGPRILRWRSEDVQEWVQRAAR